MSNGTTSWCYHFIRRFKHFAGSVLWVLLICGLVFVHERFLGPFWKRKVYRLFCQRLCVLASNMRLRGLRVLIDRAYSKAQDIVADAGGMTSQCPDAASTAVSNAASSASDGKKSGEEFEINLQASAGYKGSPVIKGEATVSKGALLKAVETADVTLRGQKTGVGGKGTGLSDTWAHARAALVLRTEAVAVALSWVAGAKVIQVLTLC